MTFQDVRPDIDEAVLSEVVEVSPPAIRARSRSEIVDVDDAKGADRCQRRDVRTAQPVASLAGPDVLPRVPAREIELANERVSAFARRRLAGTFRAAASAAAGQFTSPRIGRAHV